MRFLRRRLAHRTLAAVTLACAVALLWVTTAHANTGSVHATEDCSTWQVSVTLNDNVSIDRAVSLTTTIPGTVGFVGHHYDTTHDTVPLVIWTASGTAPASGVVTLHIAASDGHDEFTTSGTIVPATGCETPPPSPSSSPAPSPTPLAISTAAPIAVPDTGGV